MALELFFRRYLKEVDKKICEPIEDPKKGIIFFFYTGHGH
jgi:hypothetical protein